MSSSSNTSKALLVSGSAATFSQVWRMAVVFATHIALRRILGPEDWGVWHWAEPIFLLLGQVRDLGMPGHLVRMENPRPWGNFLFFEMLGGAVVGLGVYLSAPWLAQGLQEADATEVTAVIRFLVLFLIFEGLAKVPLTYFEAELRIGYSVLPEVLRNLTFAVVSIALALQGHGVASFIVAHVLGAMVFAIGLWYQAQGMMQLHWRRGANRELLRRGVPLLVMSIFVLLTGKVDPLVLGLRFSPETVGYYGMALFLAFLLAMAVALPVSRALYPALTRLKDDAVQFFEAYRLATIFLLALEVLFALGLFFNAETILVLFGGETYRQAAPLLRILCFAPLCQPFSRCAGDVLLNLHRDGILVVASVLSLLSLVGMGYLLTGWLGPQGMAWVNLLPLGTLLTTWAVYRVAPRAFGRLSWQLLQVYLLPLPLFLLVHLLMPQQTWGRLAAFLVTAAVAAGLYAWRFRRDFESFFRQPRAVKDL